MLYVCRMFESNNLTPYTAYFEVVCMFFMMFSLKYTANPVRTFVQCNDVICKSISVAEVCREVSQTVAV